jgi:hypothetical protein
MKSRVITVKGSEIAIVDRHEQDYISLTGMVKNFDGGGALIEQWLKNKDTVLFLGVWEQLNNPVFNSLEFEGIKNEAGRNSFFLSAKKWIEADLLNVALFGMTAAHWRQANPDQAGNMRDAATLEQLVVLSNLESLNAVLIHQGMAASERLQQLNTIAITQMQSLLGNPALQQLSHAAEKKLT